MILQCYDRLKKRVSKKVRFFNERSKVQVRIDSKPLSISFPFHFPRKFSERKYGNACGATEWGET